MGGILLYSDKETYSLELLTAGNVLAKELGVKVTAATINDDNHANVLAQKGATVYKITNEEIRLYDTAAVASALSQLAAKLSANIVLLSSTRRGTELAGRLAQIMNAGCLTGISKFQVIDEQIQCSRNALGGATVAIQTIVSDNKVFAITPKSFELPEDAAIGNIQEFTVVIKPSAVTLLEVKSKLSDTVDIEAAETLVIVGKGLQNQDDLAIIDKLASSIGGAVACSKPVATDKKWFPEERIVGLSGKKCKPNLAIIMGVSGQVQFMVGIRDAKTIVAVNTDENADIMHSSDYIMVADLKEIATELNKVLHK